jgi:hypothetical protein
MSDNAPTLRLPTTPPPVPPASPPPAPPAPPGRPSRGPMVAFILLCVLVVAAIGVLVYVLIGRTNGTLEAANTPSATESSAPPVAPAPPPPQPGQFTVFTVPASQQCRGPGNGPGGGPGKDRQEVDAQVAWTTTNATQVWVAQGTGDAVSAGFEQVPLAGNQDSFPTPLPINCNQRSMTFTMTLVGADGAHVSRTWTVTVVGRHP